MAVSKSFATKIGVIRYSIENSDICYVEPKEIVKSGNDLLKLRDEIEVVQNEILGHLSLSVIESAPFINKGSTVVARIDTVFARAAFGQGISGKIPMVGSDGIIHVKDFLHPTLALSDKSVKAVSIDLLISDKNGERSLIISGPNGGGKTLAMKSFGLVAIMNKLGIPIPHNTVKNRNRKNVDMVEMRVDFFKDILVEVGDNQNMLVGESTYVAQLKALARTLENIQHVQNSSQGNTLILLDEIGGGTDPESGGCISQAILEKILETEFTRTVSTTHSMKLKALAVEDERFMPIAVQLKSRALSSDSQNLPAYKLCYGTIGNSYALAAASRSTPPFPSDVLDRAANLIAAGQGDQGKQIQVLMNALEMEKEMVSVSLEATMEYEEQISQCRNAMIHLARAYDQNFSRLEHRLDELFETLKSDETNNAYDLVGDSLEALRVVKKKVKSEGEFLKERGLRPVSYSHEFHVGESIVIIAKGEYDGNTAKISEVHEDDEISVILSNDWDDVILQEDNSTRKTLKFGRTDVAFWDYPDYDEWGIDAQLNNQVKSVSDSRIRLSTMLSTLNYSANGGGSAVSKKSPGKVNQSFTSARERKASKKKGKKRKK